MPLHTYYDTSLAPVTFDFAVFLVGAESYRQSFGLSSIHLYISASSFRKASARDQETDESEKRWRVKHILGQLPNILPTVQRVTFQNDAINQIVFPVFPPKFPPRTGELFKFPYQPKNIVKQFGLGCNVQPFESSEYAKLLIYSATQGREYITITLRTSKIQPARNSDLNSWYEVYKVLKSRGYQVWILPDFEDSFADREAYNYDWPIAHFAMDDLNLRLALYEGAKDNLGVNNGICVLLTFSKAPHKLFKMVTQGIETTSEGYFTTNWMIEVGENPPFFQPNQQWIWKEDLAENILSALDY